jgi:hypothetical protein
MKILISTTVALSLFASLSANVNAKVSFPFECSNTFETKCNMVQNVSEIEHSPKQIAQAQESETSVIKRLPSEIFLFCFFLFFLFFPSLCIFNMMSLSFKEFPKSYARTKWKVACGEIISREIYNYIYYGKDITCTRYGYYFTYTYIVNNFEYTSKDSTTGFNSTSQAIKYASAKHPIRGKIKVYYNPKQHQESTLEPHMALFWNLISILFSSYLFIMFSSVFLYYILARLLTS